MIQRLYILFLFITTLGFSQSLTSSVDSTQIKIGSQLHLILKAKVSLQDHVVFPERKVMGQLEVLESYPIDTLKNNDKLELIKKYGLTQFDSGVYKIPSIAVRINGKEYFSDSSSVIINNVKVDTIAQPMFDIKPIFIVKKPASDWWKYVLFALFVMGLGFLAYYLIQKVQKHKKEEILTYASPIEKALAYADGLEKKNLWQNGNVKQYYSELTDIARVYIEEALSIPAMESTSNELFKALRTETGKRKIKISPSLLNQFNLVLKNSDLVKFAKSQPIASEIEESKNVVNEFLVSIDKGTPRTQEEVENLFVEEIKQKKAKKGKAKRIIISVAIAALFVLLSVLFFIGTIGYDYLKDNYIGHSSKELLETEWITSEYGDPAIKIETPRVLKRIIDERVQQNLPLNVKSLSRFTYGSLIDVFSITINATTFKDSVALDKDLALETDIKYLESIGAKNMFIKTDDYIPTKELTGKKAFGTFTAVDPLDAKEYKMAFEIVVFAQSNSAQEFLLIYKDGDKDAEKLMERVRNSIELKKSKL
ncbi:hypothetical protein [uncultured Flavobacterium sp.]|uniref:hypothetical protein n=1 Tax=uncultured Flavobacterium sp. TaxID=165435 RepID=UPI0030CA215E